MGNTKKTALGGVVDGGDGGVGGEVDEVHSMGNTKKTAPGGVVDGGDGEVGGEVDEMTQFPCERRRGGAAGGRERLSAL